MLNRLNTVPDRWLRVAVAVWVLLMAGLAWTLSVWLCAAVIVGAVAALGGHVIKCKKNPPP